MASTNRIGQPPDPGQIRVLLVDNKPTSRAATLRLLHESGYKASAVQTGSEALQLLQAQLQESGEPAVDIILKEHEPPTSNATRFLKRLEGVLRTVPVIVVSSYDNRDVVLKCLSLGASDYWIKPLRANEIRNLWTRVWWRKIGGGGVGGASGLASLADLVSSDEASEETKNLDEQEPTSKEGSAPDDAQHVTNGHASGNGSSGVQGGRLPVGATLLNTPDGNGNSSGNGEKGHVGSNTGMGSGGEATGHRSNGGHGNGGSGQLGSGNGASAVANGHGNTSNDGNGTANHVGSNFGTFNGNGSNGNGNHVGSNFGNGNGTGSNGNGLTANCMPYDASTTAKPAAPAHHHHHFHQHAHGHHGHAHGRHHHGTQAAAAAQQAAAAEAAGLQQPQPEQFLSPPPRPRGAGLAPAEVRPPFMSTLATDRYPSGATNGSNGNGVTSASPAAMADTAAGAAQPGPQVPTGFAAWANLHSEPGQGPLPNEVAEVAEALTSLRESGDSPGGSHAEGGAAGGSGGRASRPATSQQRTSHLVKPVPIKFSRTTISDDTRLPHSRAPGAAPTNPRAPAGSAPPTLGGMTWSDPGRGASLGAAAAAAAAAAAHFPRGLAQMPSPLVAMQQPQQHSMSAPSASLLQQQQAQQQAAAQQAAPHGLFGQFAPPPYGPLPPFMPPPIGFPWGGPNMTGQPPLDPGQMHPGMAGAGAHGYQFPFGAAASPFMAQASSQGMMAIQQAMLAQQGFHQQQQQQQQQYLLPYPTGMAPPQAYPPWRPQGPAWGQQQMPPPAMLAPTAAGAPATTQLVVPPLGLSQLARGPTSANTGAAGVSGLAGVASGLPGGGGSLAGGPTGADGTLATEAQSKREARQQALTKYKEKRKNLNASNKIRYQARKVLAEQRPRVKGQFVKVPVLSKDASAKEAAAEQGSNGGALTTAASSDVTCEDAGGGAEQPMPAGLIRDGGGQAPEAMQGVEYEDEGQEYDHQEEDLGDEEDEEGNAAGRSRARLGGRGGGGLQRMAVDAPAVHGGTRCMLQADESESATQSIGDPHQQAQIAALHLLSHHGGGGAGTAATPTSAAAAAAAAAGSLDLRGGNNASPALPSPHPHHKPAGHITGQKHKRDSGRAAAARNGSDSGSNSPGDQTPTKTLAASGGPGGQQQQQQQGTPG